MDPIGFCLVHSLSPLWDKDYNNISDLINYREKNCLQLGFIEQIQGNSTGTKVQYLIPRVEYLFNKNGEHCKRCAD